MHSKQRFHYFLFPNSPFDVQLSYNICSAVCFHNVDTSWKHFIVTKTTLSPHSIAIVLLRKYIYGSGLFACGFQYFLHASAFFLCVCVWPQRPQRQGAEAPPAGELWVQFPPNTLANWLSNTAQTGLCMLIAGSVETVIPVDRPTEREGLSWAAAHFYVSWWHLKIMKMWLHTMLKEYNNVQVL